jgi:hypothetical protein
MDHQIGICISHGRLRMWSNMIQTTLDNDLNPEIKLDQFIQPIKITEVDKKDSLVCILLHEITLIQERFAQESNKIYHYRCHIADLENLLKGHGIKFDDWEKKQHKKEMEK